MKKIIAITLVTLSANTFAVESSITKSEVPDRIVVAKAGVGLSQFSMMTMDFPRNQRYLPKRLESINWTSTYYPNNTGERVHICYTRPGRAGYDQCEEISKNSSGSIEAFNHHSFDRFARITIKHLVSGGQNQGAPAGEDSITVNYSY
ncbi:hypothetical protein QCD79_18905 [Pseudomonas quasicaspiana]|nr:hypothetical protein [Pseudomonas syringae]MDG6402079.1 hypothetical protein [Pseudomonas quasicaspiana]